MFRSVEGIVPGLAIVGHVKIGRKGEKRKSGGGSEFRLPVKLDHFIITKRDKDKDDNFIIDQEMTDRLVKKYGEKPRELDIKLLYDDIEYNFPHRLACYATKDDLKKHFKIESRSKRCFCTGNAHEAVRLKEDGKGKIECNPATCEIYLGKFKNLNCRLLARLIFTLPGMDMVGGCYDFVTTSAEAVRNIMGSLQYISMRTQGILSGIPLKLKMYAATDETETGQVKNWKVMVAYEGTEETLIENVKQIASARASSTVDIKRIQHYASRAIALIEQEEESDIAEEYFPPKDTEPEYECAQEIIDEIFELCGRLGHNDAVTRMMLGKNKGQEEELRNRLREEASVEKKEPEVVEVESADPLAAETPSEEAPEPEEPSQEEEKAEEAKDIRATLFEKVKQAEAMLDKETIIETRKGFPRKVSDFTEKQLRELYNKYAEIIRQREG